jgi:hypothetical protein
MTSATEFSQGIRLELLVRQLSDLISPVRELVSALRLQSNASATTRGELDHLVEIAGIIWEQLRRISSEIAELRATAALTTPEDA